MALKRCFRIVFLNKIFGIFWFYQLTILHISLVNITTNIFCSSAVYFYWDVELLLYSSYQLSRHSLLCTFVFSHHLLRIPFWWSSLSSALTINNDILMSQDSPLIDDVRFMIDAAISSDFWFETRSFVPHDEWNGPMDVLKKIWHSFSSNLLLFQKNALYALYNQNLLFLTVSSRLDVSYFCCSCSPVVFFFLCVLCSCFAFFEFCVFCRVLVDCILPFLFFTDTGFTGIIVWKIFICRFVFCRYLWICCCCCCCYSWHGWCCHVSWISSFNFHSWYRKLFLFFSRPSNLE